MTKCETRARANTGERKLFDELLRQFGSIDINEEIARTAGEYREQLVHKSKRIILLDCFLAAQAKVHGLTLVTNNKADFPMRDIKIVAPK